MLLLLPAVDVAGGTAVRITRGEAGSETGDGDPAAIALEWQSAGAEWVHLVDLDAAYGRGSNGALLADIVGHLDIPVEVSGGICDDTRLAAALGTGCARVILATAALQRPDWVQQVLAGLGDKAAVGLDVRDTMLADRDSSWEGGDLFETLTRLDAEGCARYVVTDVDRDGTLAGPNLDLLRRVSAATDRPIVASGGVSSLDDLRAIAGLVGNGVEGAIVGKALYTGAFTLWEALAATRSMACGAPADWGPRGSLRAARVGDVEAQQAVEVAAGARFIEVGMPEIAGDEPMPAETLLSYIAAGRSWVATHDERVVGYVLADVIDGCAHIEQVSVDPMFQGRGLGKGLIAAVESWAKDAGLPAVTLTTFSAVSWNRPLYEHLGFRSLAPDEISPGLQERRDQETAHGLDPSRRVCMRRDLDR